MTTVNRHIHDTLTSGLQLDIEPNTLRRLRDNLSALENKSGTRDWKVSGEAKTCKWSVKKGEKTIKEYAGGKNLKWSWTILLKKKNDETFTKIGIVLRKEGKNHFINITANPTAIMRGDYATANIIADPLEILTSPFHAIEGIAGKIFSQKEWRTISTGDLTLHNIEIAFPLKAKDVAKEEILLAFYAIYGARTRFKDKITSLAESMRCDFSHFNAKDGHKVTGVKLHSTDTSRNQLFSFTLYDKIAEIEAKGKTVKESEKEKWIESLRADIRVFPVFMHRLNGVKKAPTRFTLSTWIELERSQENFSKFLLSKVFDHICLGFFLKTEESIQIFLDALERAFGGKIRDRWIASTFYKASDLIEDNQASKYSRLLDKHGIPNGIGGRPFALQRVFNLTSDLEEGDIDQIIDIDDLAKKIKKQKQKSNFDAWADLKSRMECII